MRVLSSEEDRKDPDINPYVYLRAAVLQTESRGGVITGYAYELDLSARVFTLVPFNTAHAPAVLWSDATIAVGSREEASAHIERIVQQKIESFLNAWLKANPR